MSSKPSPRKWEVWKVNFNPTKGSEISKSRPAVVISSDDIGKFLITEGLARHSRNQSGLPLEPQNFEQGMSNIEGEFPSFGGVAAGRGGFWRKQKTCQKVKKMTNSITETQRVSKGWKKWMRKLPGIGKREFDRLSACCAQAGELRE